MEVKNFDDNIEYTYAKIHYSEGTQRKIKMAKGNTKPIVIPKELWRTLTGGSGYLLVDSKVPTNTKFLPMLVNGKIIIDSELTAYKITKRRYQDFYTRYPCISKLICPHHYKKNPQVRFADGVFYCTRCNRVLNDHIDHSEDTQSETIAV